MNWFKFYGQDWLTDIKITQMRIEDRLCFITLLCLASQNDGVIKNCEEEGIIQLTHLQNDPSKTDNEYTRALGFLNRLKDLSMITNDNAGNVIIVNYLKRQETNLTPYERVKRFREKKKVLEYNDIFDSSGNVIIDNARIDKNRIDNIYNTGVISIIKLFEEIDPKNKTFYRNTTQRKACEFLLKEYGMERVLRAVEVVKANRGRPYFPSITSPYELQQKWTKVGEAVLRERSKELTNNKSRQVI